jgi:hypothetical protein
MFTGYQGWIDGIRELLDVDSVDYPDSLINTFLTQGELRLNRLLRTRRMERHIYSTIDTDAGGRVLLPSDFMEVRSIHLEGADDTVDLMSPDEFYDQIKYYGSDSTGNPVACMIVANYMHFYPFGSGQTVSLIYYARVPHLSTLTGEAAEDQITDFTEYYPDALLFASALSAAPHMVDDIRLPIWENQLAKIISEVNKEKQNEHYGATPQKRRLRVMG